MITNIVIAMLSLTSIIIPFFVVLITAVVGVFIGPDAGAVVASLLGVMGLASASLAVMKRNEFLMRKAIIITAAFAGIGIGACQSHECVAIAVIAVLAPIAIREYQKP